MSDLSPERIEEALRKTRHVLSNCECRHAQTGFEVLREVDSLAAAFREAQKDANHWHSETESAKNGEARLREAVERWRDARLAFIGKNYDRAADERFRAAEDALVDALQDLPALAVSPPADKAQR